MFRKFLLTSVILLAIFAGALRAEKLRVLATFDIPADWVKQIAGDNVELLVLADSGQDIHAFEPAPRQLAALSEVQLVVEIGAGLEYWLDDMLVSAQFKGKRLSLSDAVVLHEAGAVEPDEHTDHVHGSSCDHELDPHVWMDPVRVQQMSLLLTDTLAKLDSKNADTYRENFARWAETLSAIDKDAQTTFAAIPTQERSIVTYHQNLGYFAERYAINIPTTVLGSLTTEGGDPSAKQLAQLIRLIQQDEIRAVFADATSSPRLAEQVCREAKIPAPQVLYLETFSQTPDGPQDYAAMFRYNVATIASAMSGKPHDGASQ